MRSNLLSFCEIQQLITTKRLYYKYLSRARAQGDGVLVRLATASPDRSVSRTAAPKHRHLRALCVVE